MRKTSPRRRRGSLARRERTAAAVALARVGDRDAIDGDDEPLRQTDWPARASTCFTTGRRAADNCVGEEGRERFGRPDNDEFADMESSAAARRRKGRWARSRSRSTPVTAEKGEGAPQKDAERHGNERFDRRADHSWRCPGA